MEYNKEKVDEMALALLYLSSSDHKEYKLVWKSFAWEILDRLHEKGYISNPKSKAKSVTFSEDGAALSRTLFIKYFGV